MESPLREPILDAVEEADEVTRTDETSKSRFTTILQGAVVFTVMFAALYLTLRTLTEEAE